MKREINRESGSTRLDVLAAVIVIAVIVTTSLAALVPAMNKAREAAMRARCAAQLKEIGAAMSMYADAYDGFLPWYGGYDPNFPPPFTGAIKDETTIHPYVGYRCNHANNDSTYQDMTRPCSNPLCSAMGRPYAMRMACLYEAGLINDARVFYCPANINPAYMYESYINPMPWGTAHQVYNISGGRNDWIRTGYSYYPIDGFFNGLTTPLPLPSPYNPSNISTTRGSNVPKYTARRYVQLSEQYPYLTDLIWKRADLSHKTGIDLSTNVPIGAGINALFKDGHVVYVKDQPVKIRNKTQTFFNNDYWDNWDRPAKMPPSDEDDTRYILFNLYKLIQIQP